MMNCSESSKSRGGRKEALKSAAVFKTEGICIKALVVIGGVGLERDELVRVGLCCLISFFARV